MIVYIDIILRGATCMMLTMCLGMSGIHATAPVLADEDLERALMASTADAAAHEDELLQRALEESQGDLVAFACDDETAAAIAASLALEIGGDDLSAVLRVSRQEEDARQRALREQEEAIFAAVLAASALDASLSPGAGSAADQGAAAQPHDPYAEDRRIKAEQNRAFAEGALVDLAGEETRVLAEIEDACAILIPIREAFEAAQRALENNQGRLNLAAGNPRLEAAVTASQAEVQRLQGEYTELERDIGRDIKIREARLVNIARLRAEHQETLARLRAE